MNKANRIKMVKAMEFIARNVNDEEVFEQWLINGVADGDIKYGDLDGSGEELEWYIEDDTFADLMNSFLFLMKETYRNGGLYCDRILSKPEN